MKPHILKQVWKKTETFFLSDRVGDATSSRITLLGKDGQVLFDSIENPEEMENHSNRPEFIEAEKQGSGEMVRYSDTLSKQTFTML